MHHEAQLHGVTDFFQSQVAIISSYWLRKYEEAKAKVMAFIGEFLQQRSKLIAMRKRVAYLLNKADVTGNAQLRRAALDLQAQVNQTWADQLSYESKVQTALEKIRMIDGSKAQPSGMGQDPVVTPTVIIGVVAVLAALALLLYKHIAKVKYLNKLLTDVENKVLTPQEAAALAKQQDKGLFGDILGDVGPYVIGAGVVIGGLILLARRR